MLKLSKEQTVISELVKEFQSQFESMTPDIQKKILNLIRRGIYERSEYESIFAEYIQLSDDAMTTFVKVIKEHQRLAKKLGVKVLLTQDGLRDLELIQEIAVDKMRSLTEKYIDDMRMFGLRSQIEGASNLKLSNGMQDMFAQIGRNLGAEINTAMAYSDSTIKKGIYEQAGIKKYKYVGPNDSKTRDICAETLSDPRQETGWTMDEIEASNTPFIERGGWNCRHEWVPVE